MSYLERIRACNNFNDPHYRDLVIDGKVYGQVQPTFAECLAGWPATFAVSATQVVLNPALTSYAQRTEAVAPILRELHQQGVIATWVGEAYPVTHTFGGYAEMEIERAATRLFGIKGFGIHVNGLVQKADGVHVWTATRARDKPLWPGQLDQMVAGGQPVGIGLLENVIKESQEEANIPLALAQQAKAVGTISYRQGFGDGLDHSTIYVYDLWLPEGFVPENTDGEVDSFELVPLHEIARLTADTTEFKDNCNLVNIDLLLRMGIIPAASTEHALLCAALRN